MKFFKQGVEGEPYNNAFLTFRKDVYYYDFTIDTAKGFKWFEIIINFRIFVLRFSFQYKITNPR